MNPTLHDMTDAQRVVQVANELEISEFEIFSRAYNDWYGRDADTRALERDFAQYLYFGAAPPWVRHYTRLFLGREPATAVGATRPFGVSATLLRLAGSRLGRYLLS